MSKSITAAALLVAVMTTPAAALDVTKSVQIDAAPAAVWKAIGGFCGIGDWHPAVEKCALSTSGANPQRTLSLKGGGEIVEQQEARDDSAMTYTYVILSGPLPVANYKSTISVTPAGTGSKVVWSGTFDAKGADDSKAMEVIGGVYDAGLKGLAGKAK